MRDRHSAVPASYLILCHDEKILLQLRQNSGYYDGWWAVPAGHVEPDELPVECLKRESLEELDIRLCPRGIKLALTMYRTAVDATGDRVDFFFVCKRWLGEPIIKEPDRCRELRWFPLNALPENLMHHVRDALDAIARGETYRELGRGQVVASPK